ASLLSKCGATGDLAQAKRLHARLARYPRWELDTFVGNHVVKMYASCGSVEDAKAAGLFDRMKQHSGVSWSSMISAYAQNGYPSEALEIFWAMSLEGVKPRTSTWVSVIDSCGSALAVKDGDVLRQAVKDAGLEGDVVVGTALVDMLGKFGKPEEAWRVFAGISEKNTISWNAIMSAFARNDRFQEALRVFQTMCLEGAEHDSVTFLNVFSSCSSSLSFGSVQRVIELHRDVVEGTGFHSDSKVGTALIMLYSRCGSLEHAKASFDGIVRGTVASWTAMIVAYIQSGECHSALQLFSTMDLEGIHPDTVTFGYVLSVCANAGARQHGKAIHSAIFEAGIDTSGALGIALVKMYERCGSVTESTKLFKEMPERSPHRLIAGLHCQQMDEKEIFELFGMMSLEGVAPSGVSFIIVLTTCSHAGMLGRAVECVRWMIQDFGMEAGGYHLACVVDLLGRAGRGDDAAEVVNRMLVENRAALSLMYFDTLVEDKKSLH
ncbi:hypothetical protein SELMODRAFT_124927, partial [Selaginella moellendorffii]